MRVALWFVLVGTLAVATAAACSSKSSSPGPGTPTATATPTPGSCAGGALFYDSANNVTWLVDANLSATDTFGIAACSASATQPCINASGSMRYKSAVAWVAAMNSAGYLGHTNWQLPTTPTTDPGCGHVGPHGNSFGFGCTLGAFGATYYETLQLSAPASALAAGTATSGPFHDFQPYLYWSTTATSSNGYMTFSFDSGFQGSNTAENFLYAIPMLPGLIPGTTVSGTALQLSSDGKTVYDPLANVTWLADANIAATNTFGLPRCTGPTTPALCVGSDGAMTWDSATRLVAIMNTGSGYLGQTNWTLPPSDGTCTATYGCNSLVNPMGELYYRQLGHAAGEPVVAAPDSTVGPFRNLRPYLYWSCLGDTIQSACATSAPATNFEWSFSFGNGFLGTDVIKNDLYVTAYFVGNGC